MAQALPPTTLSRRELFDHLEVAASALQALAAYRAESPARAPLVAFSAGASSILIPGDQTCLHLVEADSAEHVADAFDQVGLQADRIVEAVGLQAPTALDNQRRKA